MASFTGIAPVITPVSTGIVAALKSAYQGEFQIGSFAACA